MSDLVLVTGGAGFIGSHLVDALISEGYLVRVIDNLSRGRLENIQLHIDSCEVEFIDGDIRYFETVEESMRDVNYVFHEVATCINRSEKYPYETFDININGSYNVFKAALQKKVKKMIFSSSASVYGDPEKLPMAEVSPLNPITPYCVSKLTDEHLLRYFSRFGLKYISFRNFNVYGLRQNTDAYYTSVIIMFIKRVLNGEAPQIDGDGSQAMDFINVKDVVRAKMMAMKSNVKNEILNLGSGESTTIKELAENILKIVGSDLKTEFSPRFSFVKKRKADITKIKELLNFEPQVNIQDGLKELIEDIKINPEKY